MSAPPPGLLASAPRSLDTSTPAALSTDAPLNGLNNPVNPVLQSVFDWLPNHWASPLRIGLILGLAGFVFFLQRRLLPKLGTFLANRRDNREDEVRILTLTRVIRYMVAVFVVIVTTTSIFSELGIALAPLLGAAGVVGLAIGFGAQSLVKDFVTGFFLLLENQIRIGDSVTVVDKSGVVEAVTLRYVRLRDLHGNVHFIPNGGITTVTNCSIGFSYAVIKVGIAYESDTEQAFAAMRAVAADLRKDTELGEYLRGELEVLGVDEWANSAIMLCCRIQVEANWQAVVRRAFLHRLKHAFDHHGIVIPYPHVQVVR